jgi:hypothetical protein
LVAAIRKLNDGTGGYKVLRFADAAPWAGLPVQAPAAES